MPIDTKQTNSITPPPHGDESKAVRYLEKILELLQNDKLIVSQTDLQKFDPSTLQDHYRIDMGEYDIEVSHSKQPDSGNDFYIMLFNSIKKIENNCTDKVILAYTHLDSNQFQKFKTTATDQIERIKKAEEERRFKEAMEPIDQKLEFMKTENPYLTGETDKIETISAQSLTDHILPPPDNEIVSAISPSLPN